MSSVVILADDTISLNKRVYTDLSNGSYSELTFPDELTSTELGKNGNAIISRKTAGFRGDLMVKIIMGTQDDKTLNSLLILQMSGDPTFVPLEGYIAKLLNVNGVQVTVTYTLSGGSFTKQVETSSTTEGNSEQVLAVYRIRFAKVSRGI